MVIIGFVAEAFAFFCPVFFVAHMQNNASVQNVSEFFATVSGFLFVRAAGEKGEKDRFHFVFLSVRNYPFHGVAHFGVFCFKIILLYIWIHRTHYNRFFQRKSLFVM